MSEENKKPAEPTPLETSYSSRTAQEGDLVVGQVVKITGSIAFVDYGGRNQGYIQLSELKDAEGQLMVAEGDEVRAQIISTRGAVQLSYRKAQVGQAIETLKEAFRNQTPVTGEIVAMNKGGFEVRIEGVRAFCPRSQIGQRFLTEPASEIGKSYEFRITEFKDPKSIVVSRRVLLESQREEIKANISDAIRVGDRLQGTVTQIRDFGAFVDLGNGIEGLIHVSEISHDRIGSPADVLSVGDAVEVEVVRVEADKGRVGLSIKKLGGDPWADFADEHGPGSTLTGTVARLQDFGAFVTLAPGIDGLLHVSAIAVGKRIERPSQVLNEGQEIEVVIEQIDRTRQRIGLMTPEVAEARKPVEITCAVNDIVKGPVTRVEKYGVFIELSENLNGLIPNAEMATNRGADHLRMFPVGTEIEVKVIEIDKKRGRIRLSRKALLNNDEEEAFNEYKKSKKAPQSLGSFGDLLKDYLKEQS
ncbi:MAG: S1 RNA-binding domain-containing protein [Myxococcota bacterium]|nr:S1 RNA-binding domain-containing protein [Myxococcota bacterium]